MIEWKEGATVWLEPVQHTSGILRAGMEAKIVSVGRKNAVLDYPNASKPWSVKMSSGYVIDKVYGPPAKAYASRDAMLEATAPERLLRRLKSIASRLDTGQVPVERLRRAVAALEGEE